MFLFIIALYHQYLSENFTFQFALLNIKGFPYIQHNRMEEVDPKSRRQKTVTKGGMEKMENSEITLFVLQTVN
jgi:hypothetical protein